MTTEIVCHHCGHRFSTNATTATRCRECRRSVRVGVDPARTSRRVSSPATSDTSADPSWTGIATLLVLGIQLVTGWWQKRGHRPEENIDGMGSAA